MCLVCAVSCLFAGREHLTAAMSMVSRCERIRVENASTPGGSCSGSSNSGVFRECSKSAEQLGPMAEKGMDSTELAPCQSSRVAQTRHVPGNASRCKTKLMGAHLKTVRMTPK